MQDWIRNQEWSAELWAAAVVQDDQISVLADAGRGFRGCRTASAVQVSSRERWWDMSSVSHPPAPTVHGSWTSVLLRRDVWASLAITAMWIAVAVSALWGPNFVSTSGSSSTIIPSGIGVALFASIGTWAIAKYAFGSAQEKR
jgi:hypothetical protein